MSDSYQLPAILDEPIQSEHVVSLGWELDAILSGELLETVTAAAGRFKKAEHGEAERSVMGTLSLVENKVSFMNAISQWREDAVLELHRFSVPHLTAQHKGEVSIAMLLHVKSKRREAAITSALRLFLSTQSLLNVCFLEADFTPIRSVERLKFWGAALTPGFAAILGHVKRPINFAEPFNRFVPGFEKSASKAKGGSFEITQVYPWKPPMRPETKLLPLMLWQTSPLWIRIRVRPCRTLEEFRLGLQEKLKLCEDHISGFSSNRLTQQAMAAILRERILQQWAALEGGGVDLTAAVIGFAEPDSATLSMIAETLTEPINGTKGQHPFAGGVALTPARTSDAIDPWFFNDEPPFSAEEAAGAFSLPYPSSEDLPGIKVRRFKTSFAAIPTTFSEEKDSVVLGINIHKGVRQEVFCRVKDRMKHMFIMGMTGTGKSTFMESLILKDVENGFGLCVIDPHGDTIHKVMGRIPERRIEDVIYFDPLEKDYPIGLNLLEWKTIEERDRIIDDLYKAVDDIYDMKLTGGPIFESNYRNMMKLLMGDGNRVGFRPTILDFRPLYVHSEFRKMLAGFLNDSQLQDFLEELESTGGEASLKNLSPYITSKFDRFISDESLKRVVGQERSGFDFKDIMESRKILLLNLRKDCFGSQVSRLLAYQVISRFKAAAMQRSAIPESKRTPYFLYVDEFQNVPQEGLTELLAEARKYKLGLVLANQFAGQLLDNTRTGADILHALLGNVGIFVLFRLGINDAQVMSQVLYPNFTQNDLTRLPDYKAYVRFSVEGQVPSPFNIETIMPKTDCKQELVEKIISHSRKTYGRPASLVVNEIENRQRWYKGKYVVA